MNNTNTIELERTVSVTLNGETRTITIKRISDKHCWYTETPVICRFRTGTKLHTSHHPQVYEKSKQRGFHMFDGDYFFGTESIHNRHAKVVAWADKNPGNSGWTGNEIAK